jgi:hypothetical protein
MNRVMLRDDGGDDMVVEFNFPDLAQGAIYVRVGTVIQVLTSAKPMEGAVEVAVGADGRAEYRTSRKSALRVAGLVVTDLAPDPPWWVRRATA